MRKIFLLFWALLATTHLWAHDFVEDGIYYNFLDGNNVAVTYKGSSYDAYNNEYSGEVTIPETVTYNGTTYSVTSIGNDAFYKCSSLTSITIPNSVTSIGDRAFAGCSSLTSVTIPNSVTSIGTQAFYNCSSLTSITIGNSVTSIGSGAFWDCFSLTSVTIPNSVTSIGDRAFYYCSSLTSITIPNSVTTIGSYAFSDCSSLTSMVVEEGNTTYDSRDNCNAIIETATNALIAGCQNTIIPNSVTSIGERAFSGCSSLASITIPNSVKSVRDYAYQDCSSLTSITIPNSVMSIGNSAFRNCSSLISIAIPNSVFVIGELVFRGCSSLTSVIVENGNTKYDSRENCNAIIETATNTLLVGCQNTIIPNSVTSIGISTFIDCSSLTSITIPNSVVSIASYAFWKCTSLTSVTIPNSVTSIEDNAFGYCVFTKDNFINQSSLDAESNNYWGATIVDQDIDGLLIQNDTVIGYRGHKDTIVIPDGVVAIADKVFRSNSKIKSVTIPNSVTSIGKQAFDRCSALTSITIPESVTTIGNNAFEYCTNLTSIVWNPISCTGFWTEETTYGIFYGCENVTSVTFGDKVAEIPRCLCDGMHKLTSITIPNSVMSIGDWVFWGCSSLTSITIPNSVTSIGYAAFAYCSGLTSVTIPNSVTRIGDYAFFDCSSLTSITIGNSVTSIGKLAFDRCSALTSITIPESVTTIGNNAFEYCTNLTSIVWKPVSCTGFWTEETTYCIFYGCENVTSVAFGNKVAEIPRFLCWKMSKLTSITIPESVKTIGDYAFYECSALESIRIPESVAHIGSDAFNGCASLPSITIPKSVTSIGNYAFYDCYFTKENFINNSSLDEVANDYWGAEIADIEQDGLFIRNDTVVGCRPLVTSVVIPDTITCIGDYAFRGCSLLTALTIPNSVTSIGISAFKNCSSLNSITIPESVVNIGRIAFEGTGFYNNESNWENDVLYIDNCLIRARETITGTYNIKEDTRMIGGGAFWVCTSLESIIIPESVTNIGEYAFVGCESITSIDLPNRITSIGRSTFQQCYALTSVTIPNSVTSIGRSAFQNDSALTSITIPKGITSVGQQAFYNCPLLDTINVNTSTPPVLGNRAFYNTPASICYIPCGTKSAYEASAWAQYMGEFVEHAVELTSGICGENLYWEYADTKLTISGTGAMYDNIVECLPWAWLLDSIRSIEISEGVTHIAAYAFDGCSALRELHLPASVLTIGEYAFGNTPRLYEITCLAPEPPVADISSFTNYDAYLHAYCDAQRYYSIDPVWKNFHNVECIVTEDEVTGDVTITPSDYEATVVWLSHADAAAYALVITKNDVTFCTLKFNKYGQLTNIAFAPSRTHHNKQQAAEATSTGYSFTITGLDENTTYGYAFSVLNEESAVIEEFVGEFTTQSNVSTAVDNVDASNHGTQKLLRNGQLIIIRDGVEYNVMGQQL